MPKHHDLKIFPEYFRHVQTNDMPFQIRFADRDFASGDTVTFHEWIPEEIGTGGRYTGLTLIREVKKIFADVPGLAQGYVAFAIGFLPL